MRAELTLADVVVGIDSREQAPWDFEQFGMQQGQASYTTGDYGLLALPNAIRIERKSLPDFVGCCGTERKRFGAELERLLAFPAKAVIIEASWADLEAGEWRSRISPKSVVGSAIGWIEQGIPIVLAGSRDRAEKIAARMLFTCAKRRWRELRMLAKNITEEVTV